MRKYIIRRLLLLIPTILFVTVIIFCLVRFVPGSVVDVIEANMSQEGSVTIDRAEIEHNLGLDVPIYIQYWRWISNIFLHGDFGDSLIQQRPILPMVAERIPVTLELALLALIIGTLISLPIGIFSAIRQDTLSDFLLRTIAIIFMAVPIFWAGTLVMIYPAIWWGWSPPMELILFTKDPLGNLGMFLLPSLILGMSMTGINMRLTRTTMLEVMRQDYIRTAWAKGLSEVVVILRHALKNALIPVVTLLGSRLGLLIGGTVIIEDIFVLPGMGQLILQSLNQRDYPIISCITLLISIFVMICNLLVDISYTWLNPKISYK